MSDWTKMKMKSDEYLRIVKTNLSWIGNRLRLEGIVAKKRLDLLSTRRRLKRSYASLGKLIYEAHTREQGNLAVIFSRSEIKKLLFKIETLRLEVEIQEKEIEAYKKGAPVHP